MKLCTTSTRIILWVDVVVAAAAVVVVADSDDNDAEAAVVWNTPEHNR